jgi:hypothetical protein
MNNFKRLIYIGIILIFSAPSASSQEKKKTEFGNGIKFLAKDSTYFVKMGFRIQNRYDGIYQEDAPTSGDPSYISRFYIKRGRLKFDGFVLTTDLTYKVEFDIVGGFVRDAYLKYNFYKNLSVQYGLGKLPGNRERVVSSQKLQFVDRSQFNDAFNIDRDNGIMLYHHFKLGKSVIKETVAYTDGRGINDYTAHDGASYTGRIDFLPFGNFTDKGDYYYADFAREKTPKLMLGGVYNYNENAVDARGQNGIRLSESRTLSTVFADMMLKYRGINLTAEYCHKVSVNNNPVVTRDSITGAVLESFLTGEGYNIQLGYLFKNNVEIAGRYTVVNPEKVTQRDDVVEYTLGVSKYINQHNLKVQSDLSYQDNNTIWADKGERLILRFQIELSF